MRYRQGQWIGLIFFWWNLEMKHRQSPSYHYLPLIKVFKPWSLEDWDWSSDQKWSILGGVWHWKAEWSFPEVPKLSRQADGSQYLSTLNSLRDVICCHNLAGMAETDTSELSDQGVTSVKCIRINDQGQERETNALFLTLCDSSLPKDICIGYLRVKCRPFCLQSVSFFQMPKVRTWSPKMQFGSSVP